jgi:uncharacterized protein
MIPYGVLSDAALAGVIDEYVTREGTDYGHRDHGLVEKRMAVRRQLEQGDVVITFNPGTGTTSLIPARLLHTREPHRPSP